MGKNIGYLRVSTADQCVDRQINGLEPLCDELHIERLSALARRRPVYEKVLKHLNPGDTLVVLDLDRAFRSAKDALIQLDELRARGVSLRMVNFLLDAATPFGKFFYTVQSAYFELERDMLVQRTKEGLAAARRRGKRLGRPPKLSITQLDEARLRLLCPEESKEAIAKEYGVAPWTLTRALRREAELSCRSFNSQKGERS